MVLMVEMNFGAAFLGGFGRHSQPGLPTRITWKVSTLYPRPIPR